jgi:hypothetical protein
MKVYHKVFHKHHRIYKLDRLRIYHKVPQIRLQVVPFGFRFDEIYEECYKFHSLKLLI